jgi:hypothetical protein
MTLMEPRSRSQMGSITTQSETPLRDFSNSDAPGVAIANLTEHNVQSRNSRRKSPGSARVDTCLAMADEVLAGSLSCFVLGPVEGGRLVAYEGGHRDGVGGELGPGGCESSRCFFEYGRRGANADADVFWELVCGAVATPVPIATPWRSAAWANAAALPAGRAIDSDQPPAGFPMGQSGISRVRAAASVSMRDLGSWRRACRR